MSASFSRAALLLASFVVACHSVEASRAAPPPDAQAPAGADASVSGACAPDGQQAST